jgi:hypothetical protein
MDIDLVYLPIEDRETSLIGIRFLGFGELAAGRSLRRHFRTTLWPILVVVLLGACWTSGCGGGSRHKTPTGTSAVTVTATASGSAQTAPMTLVVQ